MLEKTKLILKNLIVKQSALLLAVAVCFIGISYFLSGKNVTDLAIVTAMGVDRDGNGAFSVTLQILTPSPPEAGNQSNSRAVYTGVGSSIETAIDDIAIRSTKTPDLGQCAVLVLGKRAYEDDALAVLTALLAKDVQHNMVVTAASGAAADILNSKQPFDGFAASTLSSTLLQNRHNAYSVLSTLRKTVVSLYSRSATAVVPLIRLVDAAGKPVESPSEENVNESGVEESGGSGKPEETSSANAEAVTPDFSETLVLKNKKSAGKLDERETAGYNLLFSKVKHMSLMLDEPPPEGAGGDDTDVPSNGQENVNAAVLTGDGDTFGATLELRRRKIKYSLNSGVPEVNIYLRVRLKELERFGGGKDGYFETLQKELAEAVRQKAENAVKETVQAAINKQSALNEDFLRIASSFYSRAGNKWLSYAEKNPDYLQKVKYTVTVHCEKHMAA